MKSLIAAALTVPLLAAQFGWLARRDYFVPGDTLTGIGISREEMSDVVLARRTELMIQSQTFSILRDPQALEGAKRITSPKLKKIFQSASQSSGIPVSFISAVAYLESWGNSRVQSSTGPLGIMQIARGTAASMGLRIVYAKRYRTVTERKKVRNKRGKLVTQTRKRRIPYTVLVRDERLIPEKAVPAAARYLARLENQYGGRDWAVWAYHCGEGCTSQVRALAEREGVGKPLTVPKVFFGAHPAKNRDLWDSLRHHMERDYSPTYWFRIKRAEQLLNLYEEDPVAFKKLYEEYRYQVNPAQRAPHRLTVWLKPQDFTYQNCDDLRREQGKSLVRAFDDPKFFGFTLAKAIGSQDPANREFYLQASPAAVGTIAYIAYETRRMHQAMRLRGEQFVPLEITSLVVPRDMEERRTNGKELPLRCSGQVFSINYAKLPAGQREALDFVLDDMGWDGYLGFIRDSDETATYNVGAAPTARDFFTRVYEDALEKSRTTT